MQTEVYKIGDSVALVSYGKSEFACPICGKVHQEEDWYPKYSKSKDCVITMKCKGCKRKLGLTVDMTCDVVVWEHTNN